MKNPACISSEPLRDVYCELGLTFCDNEGLFRDSTGQIVAFRGQHVQSDNLYVSGDFHSEYGQGVYFGNTLTAVASYGLAEEHAFEAYRLPELDRNNVREFSFLRAGIDEGSHKLAIFPAPLSTRAVHRMLMKNAFSRSDIIPQRWMLLRAKTALTEIDRAQKLASIGVGIMNTYSLREN